MRSIKNDKSVRLRKLKHGYLVYLDGKPFFNQEFMKSNNPNVSDCLYTYLYVLKVLNRFGLLNRIDKS